MLASPKLNWIDFLRGASSAYEMRLLPVPVSLGSGKGSSDSKETRGEDDESDDMVFWMVYLELSTVVFRRFNPVVRGRQGLCLSLEGQGDKLSRGERQRVNADPQIRPLSDSAEVAREDPTVARSSVGRRSHGLGTS